MARPQNPDLTKYWKICLPATLAGTVEFYLFDSVHKKPKYGSRAKLITELLEKWIEAQKAAVENPSGAPVRVSAVTRELYGYSYMLSKSRNPESGEYYHFVQGMSRELPNVPEGAIRDVRPLYVMSDSKTAIEDLA